MSIIEGNLLPNPKALLYGSKSTYLLLINYVFSFVMISRNIRYLSIIFHSKLQPNNLNIEPRNTARINKV